jgi:hypothetical protein
VLVRGVRTRWPTRARVRSPRGAGGGVRLLEEQRVKRHVVDSGTVIRKPVSFRKRSNLNLDS